MEQDRRPHVVLSSTSPDGRADDQLLFKAGFLRFAFDAFNSTGKGKPNPDITLRLTIRSDRDRWTEATAASSGVVDLLIPPNEDVLVAVTSPGWRSWPEDGSNGRLENL